MSKLTFPIAEIKDNCLVNINGKKSYFYEINPPDLSQMTNLEINCFYDDLSYFLNTTDEKSFFKFYSLSGKSYLNCNSKDLNLFKIGFGPHKRPIKTFFDVPDIYSDIIINDDYFIYNGKYRRIVSVYEFGSSEIDFNFIPQGFDYVVSFKKKEKERSIKGLERIRNSHLSGFFKSKRDIESEEVYNQAEELISDLTLGEESLFTMELYFILTENSLYELSQSFDQLFDQMRSKGTSLYIEGQSLRKLKSGLGNTLTTLIPGVIPDFNYRSHLNKTSHIMYLLPLNRSHLMNDGIKLSDSSSNSIYFDPFSKILQNRNMLVTGSSGGGKSVFVNKMIHELISDHPTVILDKGGSFKRLTVYHEGEVLSGRFNPMEFRDPVYLREIILSVVDKKRFSKLERGRLLKVIKEILNESSEIVDFKEFLERLENDFKGIILYFEDIIDLFNSETLGSKSILYVDVDQYPKDAVALLIIYLLEYFKNIETKEKILVFDECWSYLSNHESFIDECFRTFRKSGAFPIAISQGLSDFSGSSSSLYNSITNNSFIKIFFPQETITDSEVDSFDQEMINSLSFKKGEYSECYLKSSDNRFRKIIRIYLSPLELELFHTEAGEDCSFLNFFKEYSPYMDGPKETIESYVRLKYGTI